MFAPVVTRHAPNAMVSTIDHLATQAGVDVLRDGGSAVDAAIAANAVLSVTCPNMCGMGGDLWALVQDGPAEKLGETTVTQPAMLAAGVAAYRAWLAAGGSAPEQVSGHSLGEYSALVCAGAVDFGDAMTPNGAAWGNSIAGVTCDIVRDDADGVRSYLLLFDGSFATYFLGALEDAAVEF